MPAIHTCSFVRALQVASYEFTTLTCIPGVVRYRGAKIQLLDLPGIIEGAKDGKGRGRQVSIPCTTATAALLKSACTRHRHPAPFAEERMSCDVPCAVGRSSARRARAT